jgi:hypothetical protein
MQLKLLLPSDPPLPPSLSETRDDKIYCYLVDMLHNRESDFT